MSSRFPPMNTILVRLFRHRRTLFWEIPLLRFACIHKMMKHLLTLALLFVFTFTAFPQSGIDFTTCGSISITPSNLQSIITGWRTAGCTDVHLRWDEQNNRWLGHSTRTEITNNLFVYNAGIATANGTYTFRGIHNGRPFYNLMGEATSTTLSAVVFGGGQWLMTDSTGNELYQLDAPLLYPWQSFWVVASGKGPPPIVTKIAN